jgi:glutamyl-tRNA synthetase
MPNVRTRFAPSPTGYLHIGGARTALFNYLFARRRGGTFVLRVEDTDRERSTPESIQVIIESLSWLGIEWDEGPYFQSERSTLYREHIERLLSAGRAYRCTCTPEELEEKRKAALAAGRKPAYDRHCRDRRDSPADLPFTIRFKAPLDGETAVHDLIKGRIVFDNAETDDLIIARSDGTPTYNFCAVVDDATMQISHVIRGEDHLSNTPRQIQMYQAFGYDTPAFAHVPLILGLDRTRLSKRHGATSVLAYRDLGYLPEALNNYLARLGWSHGDQELFSPSELLAKFSLEQVGRSSGVFNPEKLEWVNFQHLKQTPPAVLVESLEPYVQARGWRLGDDRTSLESLVAMLQERARTLVELVDSARFYFCDDIEIDAAAADKHLRNANPEVLHDLRRSLAALSEWSGASIQRAFEQVLERHQLNLGKLAQPVRVALTGSTVSPGIFEVVEVIGRERVLSRLDRALSIAGQAAEAAPGAR